VGMHYTVKSNNKTVDPIEYRTLTFISNSVAYSITLINGNKTDESRKLAHFTWEKILEEITPVINKKGLIDVEFKNLRYEDNKFIGQYKITNNTQEPLLVSKRSLSSSLNEMKLRAGGKRYELPL